MTDSTTVRPARPEDAAAVISLCESTLDPVDTRDAEGLQRLLWDVPGVSGFVAELDGRVIGAAFGSAGVEDRVPSAYLTLITVHPAHRRQGIGVDLLTALEGSLQQHGLSDMWTGGGQPYFWWSGIPEQSTDAIAFFRSQGYQPEDETFNMRVDLGTAQLKPDQRVVGLTHRIKPDDWPGFLEWMARTWEDPWSAEVQCTRTRSPASCFVAVRDGDVVGFAAYDTNRIGLFGPMGTGPAARGTGLGAELLRCCLRDYQAQGRTECEIGWVGPADFYRKTVGAVISDRFVRLRKPRPGVVP